MLVELLVSLFGVDGVDDAILWIFKHRKLSLKLVVVVEIAKISNFIKKINK